MAHLEEIMKSKISFFQLLWSANKTFPAWVVPIPTNVATNFTLGDVISRSRICVDLESYALP